MEKSNLTVTGSVIKRLDEVVVNRIAAGEVIQRPSNALKELLENSLDAGSTFINISVKGGGLKMLKIADNGHGIHRNDMEIVCERFTTSKLREFNDLKSISTFGFRGEALASISHVGHLSIASRTKDSKCAFKANYVDGKLAASPQPCAGNVGTQIIVEDMFYNIPTRRKAFKSDSEEQQKISSVVSKYAIHNSGIAFSLRKAESGQAGNVLMQTRSGATATENISSIYGSNIGKELLDISHEDKQLKLKIKGLITNANCSTKKLNFLLFINNRLIDCPPLKHSLETIYQNYLPKGGRPFMYISLQMAPNNLDVNVHPTKHQVHFLNEEEVIECVSKCVESRLLSCDTSRTFYTQKLFSVTSNNTKKSSAKEDTATNLPAKVADQHLVRMDSKLQKIDAFFNKPSSTNTSTAKKQDLPGASGSNLTIAKFPKRKQIRLTSVLNLQEDIRKSVDANLTEMFTDHTFVGVADAEFALMQHSTKLYLVNTTKLTREFFYQVLIMDFGNFATFCFSEPAPIYDLAMLGLNSKMSGWTPADGSKPDLAQFLVKFFNEKSEMLRDYFSIDIKDGALLGIPVLLADYIPPLEGLPLLMLRLATEVNWEEEKECFMTLSRELAQFYSVRRGYTDFDDVATNNKENDPCSSCSTNQADSAAMETSKEPNKPKWEWVVEHVIYRAVKQHFLPPASIITNSTVLQLANLPDLYKVFERC